MSGPNFTYSTNVPLAAQKISATQQPIDDNFDAIAELFGVNHVGLYDPSNFGKHTYTSFPIQVSDPTTSATEMAVYAKSSTDSNGAELFVRYPSNGTVSQLTGGGTSSTSSTDGSSYLTDTLLMKWGNATVNTSGSTIVTFPTSGSLPAFTTGCYSVTYTPSSNYTMGASCGYITGVTTTQFTYHAPSTGSGVSIYWTAIGV